MFALGFCQILTQNVYDFNTFKEMFLRILNFLNRIRIFDDRNKQNEFQDKINDICPFQIFKNLVSLYISRNPEELDNVLKTLTEEEIHIYKELLQTNSGKISNQKTVIRKIVQVKGRRKINKN